MKVEHINKVSRSGYPHDKVYNVVNLHARMKDSNGEWVDAVIYEADGRQFVRAYNDFCDHFKIVEE